jgi:hypothetical protein
LQNTIYCALPSLLEAEITDKPETAVTRLRAGTQEIRDSIPGAVKTFLSLHCPDKVCDPPILPTSGYHGLFPPKKAVGVELYLVSNPIKLWICNSTPSYAFLE